jgi:U4/U6.U5 tri-snRNP component SNU23
MASNLKYKQVANVTRRTWDTETYEERAKARKQAAEEGGGSNNKNQGPLPLAAAGEDGEDSKEEFAPAVPGAAGPHMSKRAFLKARRDKVDVDSKVGTVEFVNPEASATTKSMVGDGTSIKDGVTKSGVGWHCRVCDCFLKDSHTYLDHINGRKHQRNLGYTMRVERSTTDEVKNRLERLTKEKEKKNEPLESAASTNFEDAVKQKDDEAQKRKEERARKRKERKIKVQEKPVEEDEEEEEEVEAGGMDPAMAAMMGFSGFGGGNKNR